MNRKIRWTRTGEIEIGDTFKNPKLRNRAGELRSFDRVIANPMWNQDWFTEADYDNDELGRFPAGAGFPGKSSADWGWVQRMHARLNDTGRTAVVLDTGSSHRGKALYFHADTQSIAMVCSNQRRLWQCHGRIR